MHMMAMVRLVGQGDVFQHGGEVYLRTLVMEVLCKGDSLFYIT